MTENIPWKQKLTTLVLTIVAIGAGIAIARGVYLFEDAPERFKEGYVWIFSGALLLALLPNSFRLNLGSLPNMWWAFIFAISGVCCLIFALYLESLHPAADWRGFLLFWALSILALILGGNFFDKTQRETPPLFNRFDALLSLAVFFAAFGARSWSILARSPVCIQDEIDIFGQTLDVFRFYGTPPLRTSNLGFPNLYSWFLFYTFQPFKPFIELLAFEKLAAVCASSLSIVAWYFIVRIYHPRHIALGVGIVLSCLGWHWINSRFLYSYPFDLANLSAAILFLLMGLERKRWSFVALSAVFSVLTLTTQKIGVMVFPLVAYLFLDYLVGDRKGSRKSTLLLGLWWAALVLMIALPFVFAYSDGPTDGKFLFRQTTAFNGRRELLAIRGTTPGQAFVSLLIDAFYQLQVQAFDSGHHILRDKGPLLDPLLSALFSIGLISTILQFRHSRAARLSIVGIFLFALPMVLSFPADSPSTHGLSRRMLGMAFFSVWIGVLGAEWLVQKIVSPKYVARGVIALCVFSAFLNVRFVFSDYLTAKVPSVAWECKDLGVQKMGNAVTVRRLAQSGYPVLYLNSTSQILPGNSPGILITSAVRDLANVKIASSPEMLRAMLNEMKGKPVFVVVPSQTLHLRQSFQDLPAQLADIIPPYLWISDVPDAHHIPTVRYAFVHL